MSATNITRSNLVSFFTSLIPRMLEKKIDKTVGYNYKYFSKYEMDTEKQGLYPDSQYIKIGWSLIDPTTKDYLYLREYPNKDNINFDINKNFSRLSFNDSSFYNDLLSKIETLDKTSTINSGFVFSDSPLDFKELSTLGFQDLNTPLIDFDILNSEFNTFIGLKEKTSNQISGSFGKNVIDKVQNSDFSFFLEEVEINNDNSLKDSQIKLVGYLIDKYDEDMKFIDSIILNDESVNSYIDSKVTYGKTYSYTVRAIYFIKFLSHFNSAYAKKISGFIASSPSSIFTDTCINEDIPAHPADISFYWNKELEKPFITWSEPSNKKRDIKGYLILKRSSINSPFNLLRLYDFNDASPRIPLKNTFPDELVEKTNQPQFSFIDYSYVPGETSIYSLLSYTAHGILSRYSAQFQIYWNSKTKKLEKKMISKSNAPLEYPNMMLGEVFKDCIVEDKFNKVYVYLDPSAYYINGRNLEGFDKLNTEINEEISNFGGEFYGVFSPPSSDYEVVSILNSNEKIDKKYVFNFLNVDLQKNQKFELQILNYRNNNSTNW